MLPTKKKKRKKRVRKDPGNRFPYTLEAEMKRLFKEVKYHLSAGVSNSGIRAKNATQCHY